MKQEHNSGEQTRELLERAAFQSLLDRQRQGKPIVAEIMELLDDDDQNIKLNAVLALVALGESDPDAVNSAIPKLVSLLDGGGMLLDPTAMTLGYICKSRIGCIDDTITKLTKLLDDEDSTQICRAAAILGTIGGICPSAVTHAIPKLVALLNDWQLVVCGSAAMAVAYIGANEPNTRKQAVPILYRLLHEEDPEIRAIALPALQTIVTNDISMLTNLIPELITLLDDQDPFVRSHCVIAMRAIGITNPSLVATAIPKLEKMQNDEDEVVREVVNSTLPVVRSNLNLE